MTLDACTPVSPDGRYLATFRVRKPGVIDDAFAGRAVDLVLFDMKNETEATATDHAFSTLANGSPLDFLESPARLRVTDYTLWLYSVPGLRLLRRSGLPISSGEGELPPPEPGFTRPPLREPDTRGLRERLDACVCRVAGFVLPRTLCGA